MIRKNVFLVLFALVYSANLFSQKLTYFGIEGNVTQCFYKHQDKQGLFINQPVVFPSFGFSIGQEIKQNTYFETGFQFFQEWVGVRVKDYKTGNSTDAATVLQIPLRLKYSYNLMDQKLFVTYSIGYLFGYNFTYQSAGGAGQGMNDGTDSMRIVMEHHFSNKKFMSFFEGGISLDYRTKRNIIYSFGTFFTLGTENLSVTNFTYTHNEIIGKTGTIYGKGTNLRYAFSMKLPISNIWLNHKIRTEEKPEKLNEISNSTERRFYISINHGIIKYYVWSYSAYLQQRDPLRGPLELSNWSKTGGFYFGSKIFKNLIIETGFQSQQFEHKFYLFLNDSANTGGGFSTPKDNFYVVPLNIKYQFYSKNKRLSVIPKIGITPTFSVISGKYKGWGFGNMVCVIDGDTIKNKLTLEGNRTEKFSVGISCGLSLEYALTKNLIFTVDATYSQDNKNLTTTTVIFENEYQKFRGEQNYWGRNNTINFGFKVPFNLIR
jgi:hypothetical protein